MGFVDIRQGARPSSLPYVYEVFLYSYLSSTLFVNFQKLISVEVYKMFRCISYPDF